jgi:hypothetical protein
LEQWGEENGRKLYFSKNNSLKDLVGRKFPVPDPKKTMINITNEPSGAHKKSLK